VRGDSPIKTIPSRQRRLNDTTDGSIVADATNFTHCPSLRALKYTANVTRRDAVEQLQTISYLLIIHRSEQGSGQR
jgi:hypothetical protein